MKFSIMDRTGHTEELHVTDTKMDLDQAMARFDEIMGQGHIAARKDEGGSHTVIKKFDPTAAEILFVPKLQGG